MTSLADDADLKGNHFRRTIHPQSFIAAAFIFSELGRGGGGGGLPEPPPPGPEDRKKPGLDRVKDGKDGNCYVSALKLLLDV